MSAERSARTEPFKMDRNEAVAELELLDLEPTEERINQLMNQVAPESMNVINCIECGRPWGVILDRGVLPSNGLQRLAQCEMEDRIIEHILSFWIKRDELDLSFLPQVEPEEVVFVSRSLCDFASDRFNAAAPEGPCWIRANGDGYEMPAWLLKNRKHRWAYTWNCCNIDLWRPTTKRG